MHSGNRTRKVVLGFSGFSGDSRPALNHLPGGDVRSLCMEVLESWRGAGFHEQ